MPGSPSSAAWVRDVMVGLMPTGCPVSSLEVTQEMHLEYGPITQRSVIRHLGALVKEGRLMEIGDGPQDRRYVRIRERARKSRSSGGV